MTNLPQTARDLPAIIAEGIRNAERHPRKRYGLNLDTLRAIESALARAVPEWSDDLRAVLDAASEASQVPLTWLANDDFSPEQTKAWLCEAVDATVQEGAFSGSLHQVAEEETGHVVAFTGCGPKSATNAKFLIWCVHFILKHRDALAFASTPTPAPPAMGEDDGGDWYTTHSGTHAVDWDADPARQLSIMLKPDGSVSYAVLVNGRRFSGPDAMGEEFREAVTAWATTPQPQAAAGGVDLRQFREAVLYWHDARGCQSDQWVLSDREEAQRLLALIDATPTQPGEREGMSYWAVQYPGKMPTLYGARAIAELNWYPDEGAELVRLQEVEKANTAPGAEVGS